MAEQSFDTMIIGQPCLDVNTDYDGTVVRAFGGAVLYSGYAAGALGHQTAVLAKAKLSEIDMGDVFSKAKNVTVFPVDSPTSTYMCNTYHTADRERRTCVSPSGIAPYRTEEIPNVSVKIYHLAGLVKGDIGEEIIPFVKQRGRVALDVQCMLRCVENGGMVFHDWAEKKTYLPMIDFLKTDAAEAEILTGLTDRVAAAKQLYDWGAKEVVITHNTEVLAYDGNRVYTRPIKARSLIGRTGRGDTTFAGYLNERLTSDIPTALLWATAMVSLKMETPGPFLGTRDDVAAYREMFY